MDLHMERVENLLGKATPDIEGCFKGGCFQLEAKLLHQERKSGLSGEIRFEKGQREWGQRRWLAGGASYALIGSKERVWLVPGLFLPSLPLRGPLAHSELDLRCVLAWSLDNASLPPASRDDGTLRVLFNLLAMPDHARAVADILAKATPGIDEIALSPVEAVLAAEGLIGHRFGQGADLMRDA